MRYPLWPRPRMRKTRCVPLARLRLPAVVRYRNDRGVTRATVALAPAPGAWSLRGTIAWCFPHFKAGPGRRGVRVFSTPSHILPMQSAPSPYKTVAATRARLGPGAGGDLSQLASACRGHLVGVCLHDLSVHAVALAVVVVVRRLFIFFQWVTSCYHRQRTRATRAGAYTSYDTRSRS